MFGGGGTTGSSEDEHDGSRPGEHDGSRPGEASDPSNLRRCGIDSHHCLANVGGHHDGPILTKKLKFHSLLMACDVLVCGATGEIMNTRILAEAFNIDPEQQAELFQLQRVCPGAIPGYDSSSDSEDEFPLLRLQPSTDSIMRMQPHGSRYSDSCCTEVMFLWSVPFFTRMVFCAWANQCEVTHNEQITDLTIPPGRCLIMEHRLARAKEQRRAHRNTCIENMHHVSLKCLDTRDRGFEASSKAALEDAITEQRQWGTAEQRALLSSKSWRDAASLAGRAAAGFGRGVDCNGLGSLVRTSGGVDCNGLGPLVRTSGPSDAATASGRVAASRASMRELIECQQQLIDACSTAAARHTAAATASYESMRELRVAQIELIDAACAHHTAGDGFGNLLRRAERLSQQ